MRFTARIKMSVILAIILAGALGMLSSTQSWYVLHLSETADHPAGLDVPGTTAAPALTALSLAAIAMAAALAIAGRLIRFVLGVLGIIIGACILLSAIAAMANPIDSGTPVITSVTGISGETSTRALVESFDSSFWPALALIAGTLAIVGGLAVIVTGSRWPGGSKRYQAVSFEPAAHGETKQSDEPAAHEDAQTRKDEAIDNWDELSRGDDPTQ